MHTREEIQSKLRTIMERIDAVCKRTDKKTTLVAVSKTKPVEMIQWAHEAGCRNFGENYAQEFRDKTAELSDVTDLRWHFIGSLQRNKVRYVVGKAVLIHSVGTVSLLDAIQSRAARADIVQDILVEVNLAGEPSKSGLSEAELPSMLAQFADRPNVRCLGLMTMPPFFADPEASRPYFVRLRELRDDLRPRFGGNVDLTHLSMGMTADFEVAIEEGATLIRVGTAIFGPRGT
ncbi:MAG: YggS family pyridoxal phosphate-dependent enzyme [Deltaproteobacteria bacterium]|nr:YggS family pyridoxal phosphate-dependent enzyme [Deltaproteobacteria bacterium]